MEELDVKLAKLLLHAEDCELIAKLAVDAKKRAFFAKLALHLKSLARQIEGVMAARAGLNARMQSDDAA